MLVVLDALTPAERLAFVLHDLFRSSRCSTPTSCSGWTLRQGRQAR